MRRSATVLIGIILNSRRSAASIVRSVSPSSHRRERLTCGRLDPHAGVVDEDARGVDVQRGSRLLAVVRGLSPEQRAVGRVDVHQHVGAMHQHFLLIGQLLSVGLQRDAEHHQRRLLERLDRAALVAERRVVGGGRERRPEQLVLQRLGGAR